MHTSSGSIEAAASSASRRSVLRAATWTAPTLALASAAPAFADSAAAPQLALTIITAPTHLMLNQASVITLAVSNPGTVDVPGPVTLSVPGVGAATHMSMVSTSPGWTFDVQTSPATATFAGTLAPGAAHRISSVWRLTDNSATSVDLEFSVASSDQRAAASLPLSLPTSSL